MGTKRNNLRRISEVLCYQEVLEILKIELLMSSKTKSGETSAEKLRLVSRVLLDTPKPSQIEPRLPFYHFLP